MWDETSLNRKSKAFWLHFFPLIFLCFLDSMLFEECRICKFEKTLTPNEVDVTSWLKLVGYFLYLIGLLQFFSKFRLRGIDQVAES